jgi:hypothetical protein
LPAFGDRPLPSLLSGAALAGHEPDEAHERLGRLETGEVADLHHDPERGQRVDPAQAAQPGDQAGPLALLGDIGEPAVERLDAAVDQVERLQVAIERELLRGLVEALLAEPLAPPGPPRLERHPPAVAQHELRQPMAVAHPIEARRLARPDQVADRLQLDGRHADRLQQPARMQARQLARIARIGLDPVARAQRHQPRPPPPRRRSPPR